MEDLNLPRRNLFVGYKSFPDFEKLVTSVQWDAVEAKFFYRAQFPLMMSPGMIEQLEGFTFVLEVWD